MAVTRRTVVLTECGVTSTVMSVGTCGKTSPSALLAAGSVLGWGAIDAGHCLHRAHLGE